MKRRKWWLVAAVLLIALAVYLMSRRQVAPPGAPRVEFPRHLRAPERLRMESRRTLSLLTSPTSAAVPSAPPTRRRDPMLTALAGEKGSTAVVIEANAIRNSPIGELLLQCLASKEQGDPMASFRDQTGIDLLRDLDRIAVTENGLIGSGHFRNARLDKTLGGMQPTAYGDQGTLYVPDSSMADRRRGQPAIGIWNEQMVIIGQNQNEVRSAVDRLEGRAPPKPPLIPEESSYGEVYGVISADQLAHLVGQGDADLAKRVRQMAQRIEIHVDTRKDVALVAEVSGPNQAGLNDLAATVSAMFSLARLNARVRQERDLSELLDLARIEPRQGQFTLELALPMEFLEKQLAWCRPKSPPNARDDR